MPRGKRLNWAAIKADYLHGRVDPVTGAIVYMSFKELANKHGCSVGTLEQMSHKENWPDEREAIGQELLAKTKERVVEIQADKLAEKFKQDLQIVRIAKSKWLEDIKEGKQSVSTGALVQILKYEQEILELVYGVEKPADKVELDITFTELSGDDRKTVYDAATKLRAVATKSG